MLLQQWFESWCAKGKLHQNCILPCSLLWQKVAVIQYMCCWSYYRVVIWCITWLDVSHDPPDLRCPGCRMFCARFCLKFHYYLVRISLISRRIALISVVVRSRFYLKSLHNFEASIRMLSLDGNCKFSVPPYTIPGSCTPSMYWAVLVWLSHDMILHHWMEIIMLSEQNDWNNGTKWLE